MLEDESDKKGDHKPLILGINSSERRKGDTVKSLDKVLRRIQKCGGRAEIIHGDHSFGRLQPWAMRELPGRADFLENEKKRFVRSCR